MRRLLMAATGCAALAGCGGGGGGGGGSPPPPPGPPPAPIVYLSGNAGPLVAGSVAVAGGTQNYNSANLLVVSPAAPASPVTIAAGGQHVELLRAFQSRSVDTVARTFSGQFTRYSFLARGGNIVKLDLLSAATPVLTQWSTLTLAQICSVQAVYADFEIDTDRGAVIFRAPGPDGLCGNADDTFRALRMGMTAADAPMTVPEPVESVKNPATLATVGWLVRNGAQLARTDANFQGALPLGFTAGPDFAVVGSMSVRGSATYHVLIRNNNELRALNMSTFVLGPALRTLLATDILEFWNQDDMHGYLTVTSGATLTILRVSMANPATLETVATDVTAAGAPGPDLVLTTNRVAYARNTDMAIRSVPKTGGMPVTVYAMPAGTVDLFGPFFSGANLAFETFGPAGPTVGFVNPDDASSVLLPNSSITGFVEAEPSPLLESPRYVIVASPAAGATTYGGAPIRLYDGANRSIAVDYGALPAGGFQFVFADSSQSGQATLLGAFAFVGGQLIQDLFFFRNDRPGFTRVTSNIAASAATAQSLARARPGSSGPRLQVVGPKRKPMFGWRVLN